MCRVCRLCRPKKSMADNFDKIFLGGVSLLSCDTKKNGDMFFIDGTNGTHGTHYCRNVFCVPSA